MFLHCREHSLEQLFSLRLCVVTWCALVEVVRRQKMFMSQVVRLWPVRRPSKEKNNLHRWPMTWKIWAIKRNVNLPKRGRLGSRYIWLHLLYTPPQRFLDDEIEMIFFCWPWWNASWPWWFSVHLGISLPFVNMQIISHDIRILWLHESILVP